MKNLLIAFIFITGIMLAGCNKEYMCDCTVTQILMGDTSVSNVSTPLVSTSTKKAKAECEVDATQTMFNITQITKCNLK